MAIKAIINNTEKEIEQIKNNNEQDIDYVYSRIGDTEVEGEPPISIKSIGGNLADYRIYGQTSRNLFDGEIEQGGFNGAGINVEPPYLARIRSKRYISVIPNTIYSFSVSTALNIDLSVSFYDKSDYTTARIGYVNWSYGNTLTFTTPTDCTYIRVLLKTETDSSITPSDISNIMLNSGSTPLPYEPYGESVGDRTGNLFDGEVELGSWDIITQPCSKINAYRVRIRNANFIKVAENSTYSVTMSAEENVRLLIHFLDAQRNYISETTWINNISNFNTPSQCEYINIIFKKGNNEAITLSDISNIMLNSGTTPLPYEPYGYKVPVTVSNGTDTLTTPIYLPEQIKKVGDEAEYISYADQKLHRVGADDIDVTLPALPTIKGTNTFSVNTSIQPLNIYIKDSFDYKKVFTATRTIEDELPLNYKSIEDSNSTLSNYRIYGNTEILTRLYSGSAPLSFPITDGAVSNYRVYGQTSRNLFDYTKTNRQEGKAKEDGSIIDTQISNYFDYYIPVNPNTTYTFSSNQYSPTRIYYFSNSKQWIGRSDYHEYNLNTYTFTTPNDCYYIQLQENQQNSISEQSIMFNEGSIALPYEPYGENVGDRTGNLWDEIYTDITATMETHFRTLTVPNGEYTLSTTMPIAEGSSVTNLFLCTTEDPTPSTSNNGVYAGHSKTVTVNDGQLFIFYRAPTTDPRNYHTMLNSGSTALPYEPYGYKVPIAVTNSGTTSNETIYLPEPIKMVGEEAEYIDYAEQKQHRVRKNLLQNTATSQTINGVTFTVNADGSVTLSGQLTADKADLYLAVTNSIILSSGEYYISCKNADTKYYFIFGGSPSAGQIPYTEIVNDNDIKVICRGGGIGYCLIRVVSDVDTPVILYPMIRKADIEDDTYEPYIENTDLDVTLPALPTLPGTNVLSVGTAVQPSSVAVDVDEVVSCGDKTENLLDENILISSIGTASWYFDNHFLVSSTPQGDDRPWNYNNTQFRDISLPAGTYCLSGTGIAPSNQYAHVIITTPSEIIINSVELQNKNSFNLPFTLSEPTIIGIEIKVFDGKFRLMLNAGSIAEPYGKYKIPVTLTADSAETTNIYLDEPLRKVGDEAEYIDYGEQKQHFADGTSVDVTLPALPTFSGTNTLSVGTEVQPSKVYIKGKIKEIN